jgi:hypothetical protein
MTVLNELSYLFSKLPSDESRISSTKIDDMTSLKALFKETKYPVIFYSVDAGKSFKRV